MANYTNLLNVMKQAGVNANESQKPVNISFGKVISTSPLKIQIEQKITLTKVQLVLTKNVTDYDVTITENNTQKVIKIHNALQTGDEVILLRMQGGQKYIVIDKVV